MACPGVTFSTSRKCRPASSSRAIPNHSTYAALLNWYRCSASTYPISAGSASMLRRRPRLRAARRRTCQYGSSSAAISAAAAPCRRSLPSVAAASSVSATTDLLITGEGVGASKLTKAEKLEVEVVEQGEIWKLLIEAGVA